MTETDDVQEVEDRLRGARWDLPTTDSLLGGIDAAISARRRRRRLGRLGATGAAALLIGAVAVGLPKVLPSAHPDALPAASGSLGSSTSLSAATLTVTVGAYTFSAPTGWTVDPTVSTSTARFGRGGLENDNAALQVDDMAVRLESREVTLQDEQKIWISVLTPQPTREHPGPRPAATPTDRAAAARTVVDVESVKGVAPSAVTPIGGVKLGVSRLVAFDRRNAIVFVVPTGSTDVVIIQAGNASVDTLVAVAASGRP